MAEELQLALRVQIGREAEIANELWAACPEKYRKTLAALAAEIVTRHESAFVEATRVLVVPAGQAETVLADLGRK